MGHAWSPDARRGAARACLADRLRFAARGATPAWRRVDPETQCMCLARRYLLHYLGRFDAFSAFLAVFRGPDHSNDLFDSQPGKD